MSFQVILAPQDLGLDDDLIESGALDSLAAVTLVQTLERDLNLQLSATTLFDSPTIRSLASSIVAQAPDLGAGHFAYLGN